MGGGASDVTHEVVDEEFGDSMHNTVVLCSAEDTFTLNQVGFILWFVFDAI